MQPRAQGQELSLYSANGHRKYLNRAERQRALAEMAKLHADQALFCLTLAWSGARISEVLALTPSSVDLDSGTCAIRTLKRRKHHVRELPLPPELIAALEKHFKLSAMQRDTLRADSRLWPWHRTTAYRLIKRVLARAGVAGRQACPKGFRHAFCVSALQCGVPINLAQRWLGHAQITTTAIYANVSGAEEQKLASLLWQASK